MNTIGIYGSGQIGKSLAVLFTGLGLKVRLFTRDLEKSKKEIKYTLRMTKKMSNDLDLEDVTIYVTDELNDLKDCELIIEAVSEDIKNKISSIKKIDSIANEKTIISSTTSTKSITELSMYVSKKSNFIGLHFFNPPALINYLEIVKGEYTSDEVVVEIKDFCQTHNRKYIFLAKENPGFIVNRALFLMLNETIYELYEGLATAEEIDNVFKGGLNHPMGPIELCDFVGLDIVLDILNTLYSEYNDTKYRPCYLLKQKVRAGKLGKKTKEGFYKY